MCPDCTVSYDVKIFKDIKVRVSPKTGKLVEDTVFFGK